jgi:hypothetical protein
MARDIREGVEKTSAAIAARKALIKRVVPVVVWSLIPLLWFLPVGAYMTYVRGGGGWEYRNVYAIWAWGWESMAEGWFGRDYYTDLATMEQYMGIALFYAIALSLLLAWQGVAARKGHRPGEVFILPLIVATYQVIVSILYQVVLVLGIVQCAAAILLGFSRVRYLPTPSEVEQFKRAAMHIGRAGWDMQNARLGSVDKGKVEGFSQDLAWLETIAWKAGVDIVSELKAGKNAVPGLRARYNMRVALSVDGTVSVDHLLSVSGLKREQFDSLLLDMCRQLDLSTDGKVVSAKPEKAAIDLLQEIDAYFARWRETSAEKLGKI